MRRPLKLAALLALAAFSAAQTPPPQTTPIRRGSGWAEAWQARWRLAPTLEVNLATGNLACAITTGRFHGRGLPPHHSVTLVHNAQRANASGDFTGGFDLGAGWSSNLGITLSFPSSTEAELVLADGNVIGFEDLGGTWVSQAGALLTLEPEGSGWVVTDKRRWKVHLDSAGRLASIESAEGNEYVVTWGADGVSAAVEPSGRGSTFDYDGAGRLDTVDYPTGTYWALAYDASGRLASVTNADYGTVSMTYDAAGRIQSFTDYEAHTWEFEYWGHPWHDRVKTITFPDQTTASIAYSGLVNRVITTVTDQRGAAWKSVHDVSDSPALQATIDPYSKIAVYAYDANKRLTSYEDELGHEWTYAYDAQGNLLSATDPLLRATSFVHDSLDRLKEVELGGESTHVFYADVDHPRLPTTVVEPRDDDNVAAISGFDYYGPSPQPEWNGQLEEVLDAEGVSSRFLFDAQGLLASTEEGPATAAARIEAVFDGVLGPTYVQNGVMGYPSHFPACPAPPSQVQGRLEWSLAPGGESNWRGQQKILSFDVVAPIDSGSGWEQSNVRRTFQRDHLGRVTSFTEQSEETIAHATSPPATPPVRTIDVDYHDAAADGAVELTLPDGDRWIWRYDLAGRLTSVSHDDGSGESTVCTRTYFDNGRLQSSTYAAGSSSHYTYEDNGLVASIEHRLGAAVLLRLDYAYDARNLPYQVTETSSSGTLVKAYGYDQRRRLTYESRNDGTTLEERAYAYDQVGNRIEREVHVGGALQETTLYHYDREDVATYQSDNNRLMWSETLDGSSTLLSTTWYFYENPFGHVSRVVTQAAGTTAFHSKVFRYTVFGQPWLSWLEGWDDLGLGPINVVREDVVEQRADRFLPRMWRERDGSTFAPIGTAEWSSAVAGIVAAYSADGASGAQTETFARLLGIGRQTGASFTAELTDSLGSIRRTVTGSTVAEMDYRAFGEQLGASSEPFGFGGAFGARRSFAGVDLGGGELVQMGWRMLAPADGRFAMRDPMGLADGPNVYTFVHNGPTWLVDPSGQQCGDGGFMDGVGDAWDGLVDLWDFLTTDPPRGTPVWPQPRPEGGEPPDGSGGVDLVDPWDGTDPESGDTRTEVPPTPTPTQETEDDKPGPPVPWYMRPDAPRPPTDAPAPGSKPPPPPGEKKVWAERFV